MNKAGMSVEEFYKKEFLDETGSGREATKKTMKKRKRVKGGQEKKLKTETGMDLNYYYLFYLFNYSIETALDTY